MKQFIRELWARGKTTRVIPWWNLPRCHNCGRIAWGHIPCIETEEGMRCWDCEKENQLDISGVMDLELAFGKATKGPSKERLRGYGYVAYPTDE